MKTLLVASTGGHLKQLHELRGRLGGVPQSFRWVTFDTPQSRSLLADEPVDFVPFVGGRDPLNVARNFGHARRILAEGDVAAVVSTGSSVALPFFVLASLKRVRRYYIESAARSDGPSLTGKLISAVPGTSLFAQYESWSGGRWGFRGSVFDGYEELPAAEPRPIGKVVVTLGTYRGFGFPLLISKLLETLPAEAEVLWQVGDTDVSGFPIAGQEAIPERELSAAMREADLVVAHAGVGAALAALEVGKSPLLVPRRESRGEHIDDHQIQIAKELSRRRLATTVEAPELSESDLVAAAARRVGKASNPPVLELA